MRRRRFLALSAGSLAAGAGCVAAPPDADGNPAETRTTGSTTTGVSTSPPATVKRVSMAGLQPGRIELTTPDSIGVVGQGTQSLFVSVDPGEPNPPARSDFSFELDGSSVSPIGETHNLWRRSEPEFGEEYTPTEGGWLAFELPANASDGESARLRWPGGSWRPPADIRDRLASPAPTFRASVDAPATVPLGSSPEATVTFENTSSVSGTFLLAVNRVGPYIAYAPAATVRRLLEPGESATATVTTSISRHAEIEAGDTTDLRFQWLGGETERTIEFVE